MNEMAESSKLALAATYLRLLEQVDPEIMQDPGFAQEFAARLVGLTDTWATDHYALQEEKDHLLEWLTNEASEVNHASSRARAEESEDTECPMTSHWFGVSAGIFVAGMVTGAVATFASCKLAHLSSEVSDRTRDTYALGGLPGEDRTTD
jgi:hypothetical protein